MFKYCRTYKTMLNTYPRSWILGPVWSLFFSSKMLNNISNLQTGGLNPFDVNWIRGLSWCIVEVHTQPSEFQILNKSVEMLNIWEPRAGNVYIAAPRFLNWFAELRLANDCRHSGDGLTSDGGCMGAQGLTYDTPGAQVTPITYDPSSNC